MKPAKPSRLATIHICELTLGAQECWQQQWKLMWKELEDGSHEAHLDIFEEYTVGCWPRWQNWQKLVVKCHSRAAAKGEMVGPRDRLGASIALVA